MPTTETILIEFAKAVKAVSFYPEDHPNLDLFIEKTFNLLKNAVQEKGELKWTLERTGFLEGKLPIGRSHQSLEALAKELFLKKRIREITITRDATFKELKDLLFILTMDADGFKKAGDLENLLLMKEMKGIQLNAMSYEDIRKSIIELKEAEKQKEMDVGQKELVDDEKSIDALDEAQPEQEIIPPGKEEGEEKEETLAALLKKLEQEEDIMAYQAITQKIMEKITPLREEKKWEELFPSLVIFTAHAEPKGKRHPEQKTIASRMLKELLNPDTMGYLMKRLCNRHEERRAEIQHMLTLAGEQAINQLLTALIDTDEAHARRHIFNTLALFGEMVRVEAEKRLADERWYVVRQMVSLLGETGSPWSIDPIKMAFEHKDMRIKKEVLKALGKISSRESTKFLLQRLRDKNPSLKLQAIISLGMLKDPASVKPLRDIVFKKGFFKEHLEIRKEAVRSIGMMSGNDAIDVLTRLLKKKVFWGKKENNEMRSLAAIALGKIGGKVAMEILEDVSKNSTGIIHSACKKAMEGIK